MRRPADVGVYGRGPKESVYVWGVCEQHFSDLWSLYRPVGHRHGITLPRSLGVHCHPYNWGVGVHMQSQHRKTSPCLGLPLTSGPQTLPHPVLAGQGALTPPFWLPSTSRTLYINNKIKPLRVNFWASGGLCLLSGGHGKWKPSWGRVWMGSSPDPLLSFHELPKARGVLPSLPLGFRGRSQGRQAPRRKRKRWGGGAEP